jgi:hypothetical protein
MLSTPPVSFTAVDTGHLLCHHCHLRRPPPPPPPPLYYTRTGTSTAATARYDSLKTFF